jgi:hypothetical protein
MPANFSLSLPWTMISPARTVCGIFSRSSTPSVIFE